MKYTLTEWLWFIQNKCLRANTFRENEYIHKNNLPFDCSTKVIPILFRPLKQQFIGPICNPTSI